MRVIRGSEEWESRVDKKERGSRGSEMKEKLMKR